MLPKGKSGVPEYKHLCALEDQGQIVPELLAFRKASVPLCLKYYWDEFKEKLKEEKDKWKEKYNEAVVDNDWYTVDAEEILRQRFASGEIDQDEFEMRMKILRR